MNGDPDVGTSGRGSGLLASERGQLQYLWMYKFVFEHPDWLVNSLLLLLANIIPVVGPIILLGYGIELIEHLHVRPDRLYHKFDFNRFTTYLTRGIWPFLAAMICGIALAIVAIPAGIVGLILSAVAADAVHPALGFVVMLGVFLLLTVVVTGIIVCSQPIMLRAGLTQDIKEAFSIPFIRGFLSLVWREMLISMLWLYATGVVLWFAGLCVCFVGVFLAAVVAMDAHWHSMYQLYELYLDRGGVEIPLKSAGEI